MTPELKVLILGALLQFAQITLAAWSMGRDGLGRWNAGPRDTQPQFSPLTGRLRRAVDNQFEALILFGIGAIAIHTTGASSALTTTAAWAWLAARILYIPAYALGWTPWRSAIYGIGAIATLTLLLTALLSV